MFDILEVGNIPIRTNDNKNMFNKWLCIVDKLFGDVFDWDSILENIDF